MHAPIWVITIRKEKEKTTFPNNNYIENWIDDMPHDTLMLIFFI